MKKDLLISVAILAFIFIGGYSFVFRIKESIKGGFGYGTQCEETSIWLIGEFQIQERTCIGYAGPHFYKYDLLKKEKVLVFDVTKIDSCHVEFEFDSVVKFNLCENKLIKSEE